MAALAAGVSGKGMGSARVLLQTCNGQNYNPSQYYCLTLPGEICLSDVVQHMQRTRSIQSL